MTQLESFTAYCQTHPEERFWQALRNWSPYAFIMGANPAEPGDVNVALAGTCLCKFEDTFYK